MSSEPSLPLPPLDRGPSVARFATTAIGGLALVLIVAAALFAPVLLTAPLTRSDAAWQARLEGLAAKGETTTLVHAAGSPLVAFVVAAQTWIGFASDGWTRGTDLKMLFGVVASVHLVLAAAAYGARDRVAAPANLLLVAMSVAALATAWLAVLPRTWFAAMDHRHLGEHMAAFAGVLGLAAMAWSPSMTRPWCGQGLAIGLAILAMAADPIGIAWAACSLLIFATMNRAPAMPPSRLGIITAVLLFALMISAGYLWMTSPWSPLAAAPSAAWYALPRVDRVWHDDLFALANRGVSSVWIALWPCWSFDRCTPIVVHSLLARAGVVASIVGWSVAAACAWRFDRRLATAMWGLFGIAVAETYLSTLDPSQPVAGSLSMLAALAWCLGTLLIIAIERGPRILRVALVGGVAVMTAIGGAASLRFLPAYQLELAARKAIAKEYPGDAIAWLRLADAALFEHDLPLANRALEEALSLRPDAAAVYEMRGRIAADQARWPVAIEDFQRALELERDRATTQAALAGALIKLPDLVAAERAIDLAFDLDEGLPENYVRLGQLRLMRGRTLEAIEQFKLALARDPTNAEAHYELGGILVGTQDRDAGLAELAAAIRYRPNFAGPYHTQAAVQGGLAKTPAERQTAIASARKAVSLRPDFFEAWFSLATLHYHAGQYGDAATALREAARIAPDNPHPRFFLGIMLLDTGKKREAITALEDALTVAPTWTEVAYELGWLQATDADASIRNGRAALELGVRFCRRLKTPDARLWDVYAAALAELGRYDEAAAVADEAIEKALAAGKDDLALDIQQRRDQYYQSGLPFRSRRK